MPATLQEMGNIDTSVTYFQRYKVPHANRVLDIGTHFGSFVCELQGFGYERITGIDIDLAAIKTGVQEYPPLRGCILPCGENGLPFATDAFDAVTMFDVLEHLVHPDQYLCEVYRILRPNGLLIFQTPNMLTNIPWEILQHRSFTYWRQYHRSLQTLTSLKKLLKQSGFEDIRIEKHSLISSYNADRARRVFGRLGITLMHLAGAFPLFLHPNFWGACRKPALAPEISN